MSAFSKRSNGTRGFFITGTGTEVGKTYVTAAMAREMTARGLRVGVYKPVASGCLTLEELQQSSGHEPYLSELWNVPGKFGDHCTSPSEATISDTMPGDWNLETSDLIATDALALWHAAGQPRTLRDVCPQRFRATVAPNVAARMEGQQVDSELLRIGVDPWLSESDVVLVEGAGGVMSPLSDDDYNAHLAADLGMPVVVVAANRLGVINDTLQTVITASVWDEGLEVAGVVLNKASEALDDKSLATNADQLRQHLRVPLLGELAYGNTSGIGAVVDALLKAADA